MTFPRYFEERPELTEKTATDRVDLLLVRYHKLTKDLRKAEERALRFSYAKCRDIDDYMKKQQKLSKLRTDREAAYLAVLDAMDESPDWIYAYMSPFGEAYVRNREEAVEIDAKVGAIEPRGGMFKGKKLAAWKDRKRKEVLCRLKPIKLGPDGGAHHL